jgi:type I restriction enzyme S subunit
MTGWRQTRLGEALDVRHGFAFKGEHFRDSGKLIVMTPGNFHDEGGFKAKSGKEKYYDGPVPSGYLLSRGDVVVAMTEQTRGLLGSTATIPVSGRYLHNQRLGLLRVTDPGKLDLRFCYHLLNTPGVRHQIQATATGSKVRHTAPERIRAVRVALPDVRTQRTIAGVLDAVDDLTENNRRRIELLGQMVQATYREWFVRFRYPGHESEALVDSSLGPIPEAWLVTTCGDAVTVLGGGTPSKKEPAYWDDGTIPWFTPSDLTERRTRFAAEPAMRITEEGLRNSSARLFPAGSVLMTSRATLGVLAIATTEASCNQGFIVIPPDERWPPSFIYEWLDHHADALETLGTGATFKEITKGAFKRFPFLLPSPEVIEAFRNAVTPVEGEVRVLEHSTRNLEAVRDLLLPKLVTGQIDVSNLDLDVLVGSVA